MTEFRHIYDLGGSVESWERRIRDRIENVVDGDVIDEVRVDETTGIAAATLDGAEIDAIEAIDEELVIETIDHSRARPDRMYVNFGCIIPAE